jgi:palmitoyltransferase
MRKSLVYVLDKFAKICGPLLVLIAPTLILFIGWTYLRIIVYKTSSNQVEFVIHVMLAAHLLLLILFQFIMACRTDSRILDYRNIHSGTLSCNKCANAKPQRAHHCSICDVCILKMDHHCPWINNCVGHFNHRYFYLLIFYISIACIIFCIMGTSVFLDGFVYESRKVYKWPFVRARTCFLVIKSFGNF